MVDNKDKIISYRRAEWLTDSPGSYTLERALRDAHQKLKTVADRTIERDSGQCIKSLMFHDDRPSGVFLHVSADTPGEQASIVPVSTEGTTAIDVGTAPAPDKNEFMDGDAFLFVLDDHVSLCTTGLRDGSIRGFLYEFFRKAKLRKDADQFEFMKVADVDKIKVLKAQGVKEIELRASMFAASASYHRRKGQVQTILGAATRHFRLLFGKPDDFTDDSLRITITIRTDARSRKHLSLGEKRIEKIAEDLINEQEDDDDFIIHTESGQKISPHEIYVRSKVRIQKKGKSVDRDKAWGELEKFYDGLVTSGAIEV